jgi:hypothetical protein
MRPDLRECTCRNLITGGKVWHRLVELLLNEICPSYIRLPSNTILMRLLEPHLSRPVGRPPKSGIQVRIVDLH